MMTRNYLYLFISFLVIGCSTYPKSSVKPTLKKHFRTTTIPSAVMGSLEKDGQVEWYSFGIAQIEATKKVSEKNIYRIFSMTKPIVSVAAMQLVERGEISLDEPLNEIMPEMTSIPILFENGVLLKVDDPITLRQLLTHTSGFGYTITSERLRNFNQPDWEYKDYPRLFVPGEHWHYGTSLDWVGRLIEKISGDNLEVYLRKNITGPLEMDRTWFNVPDSLKEEIVSWGMRRPVGDIKELDRIPSKEITFFSGGGGLFGSPEDYLKFLQCLLNYGEYDGGRILEKETVLLMMEDHLPEGVNLDYGGQSKWEEPDRWGLGWAIEANENETIRPIGAVYWSGLANTYFTLDMNNKIALVYFSNLLPSGDKECRGFYRLFEEEVYSKITRK